MLLLFGSAVWASDFDLSLKGNWPNYSGGSAIAVAITNGYGYVADGNGGLQVIDVSSTANPQRVGGYIASGYAYGVVVAGNYAYVAHGPAGLQIIDIRNPANPQQVGGYDTSGSARGLAISGHYAYVADYLAGPLFRLLLGHRVLFSRRS